MDSVKECVRCTATTSKRQRCSKSTCIYPGLCRQHFIQRHGLKLAPSSIPNGGWGLFTTKEFPANSKIADYTGNIVSTREWNRNQSSYGASLGPNRVIDARSTQSGIARYSNDCRNQNRGAGHCRGNNSSLRITRQNKIILESTRRLAANEEVFNAYGGNYWAGGDE